MTAADITNDARYREMLGSVRCAESFEIQRGCDYIIKGLLDRQQEALISGPPNCGKTFFLIDLMGHVAAGLPRFFGMKVRRMPALYFCAEGSMQKIQNRFIAWCQHHRVDHREVPFAVLHFGINLLDRANNGKAVIVDLDRVCALIQHYSRHWGESPLVALDTVTAVAPGGNLNQPSDSSLMTSSMREMKIATDGGACVGVHHSPLARAGEAAGHHNFKGQPDVAVGITEGAGGIRAVTSPKQRDSAKLKNLHFTLATADLGVDEEGDPLTTCVVVPYDGAAAAKATSGADTKQETALNVLRGLNDGEGAEFSAWLQACLSAGGTFGSTTGKNTAARALNRMANDLMNAGRVERIARGSYRPTNDPA